MKLKWLKKVSAEEEVSNEEIKQILFHEGSLTRLLQESCSGLFNVQVLSEAWQQAMTEELTLLSLKEDEISFIRKSLLKNNEQILVYARTVIPEKTLTGENEALASLGDKPLGDFLFSHESTYRSEIRYAKIPVDCELHIEANRDVHTDNELWGRQSLIYIEQKPLLITEVFLPAILECKIKSN